MRIEKMGSLFHSFYETIYTIIDRDLHNDNLYISIWCVLPLSASGSQEFIIMHEQHRGTEFFRQPD